MVTNPIISLAGCVVTLREAAAAVQRGGGGGTAKAAGVRRRAQRCVCVRAFLRAVVGRVVMSVVLRCFFCRCGFAIIPYTLLSAFGDVDVEVSMQLSSFSIFFLIGLLINAHIFFSMHKLSHFFSSHSTLTLTHMLISYPPLLIVQRAQAVALLLLLPHTHSHTHAHLLPPSPYRSACTSCRTSSLITPHSLSHTCSSLTPLSLSFSVHKLSHFFDVVHGTRHDFFMSEYRALYMLR
jgi:hypothetical protein